MKIHLLSLTCLFLGHLSLSGQTMEESLGLVQPTAPDGTTIFTVRPKTERVGLILHDGKPADKSVKVYGSSRASIPLFFQLGKVGWEPDKKAQNDRALWVLIKVMKKHPSAKFLIEGHTCDLGKEKRNLTLSWQRAEAVKAWLIVSGVDPLRLVTLGFGEKEGPAHFEEKDRSLSTEAAREPYRRVVIRQLAD